LLFISTNVPAKSFEDLIVWQKAHQFVLAIYALTESFPRSELFGLTSQMRRAGISIPSNIAEGFKKRCTKEKVHLLNVAQASLEESQYYLILTRDLRYGDTGQLRPNLDEISRMLESYVKGIERNHALS
jgi:four helix bundle protein